MKTSDLISKISKEVWHEPGSGWVHDGIRPGQSGEIITNLPYFLYQSYYLGLRKVTTSANKFYGKMTAIAEREDKQFASELEQMLAGQYYKSTGWRIVSRQGTSAIIERNGIVLSATSGEWLPETASKSMVTVDMPTARRYASPGFFSACGTLAPPDKTERLDRLYINVAQNDAATLFAKVLELASAMETAITAKVANTANAYDRCDTLVAYLPRRFFQQNLAEFVDRLNLANLKVRPTSPAFTKQLKKGVSWAQDPLSDGCGPLGFGMHRCRIIAQGMEKASAKGHQEIEESILQEWQISGLDVDAPHLSPSLPA